CEFPIFNWEKFIIWDLSSGREGFRIDMRNVLSFLDSLPKFLRDVRSVLGIHCEMRTGWYDGCAISRVILAVSADLDPPVRADVIPPIRRSGVVSTRVCRVVR